MYTTPTFAGLNASMYYSPNAQEAVQTSATSTRNGNIWGATARADVGSVLRPARLRLQRRQQPRGRRRAVRSEARWKLGASWATCRGRIGLIGTLRLRQPGARPHRRRQGRPVGLDDQLGAHIGNFQVLAQYGQLRTEELRFRLDAGQRVCGDSGARAYHGRRCATSCRSARGCTPRTTAPGTSRTSSPTTPTPGYTSVNGAPFPYGADPEVWALASSTTSKRRRACGDGRRGARSCSNDPARSGV